jgi:hypothetical protein
LCIYNLVDFSVDVKECGRSRSRGWAPGFWHVILIDGVALPRKLQPLSKAFLCFENGESGFLVNFAPFYTTTWCNMLGNLSFHGAPCVQVMPKCKEMMPTACWWRNEFRNCCDIFELQRSEIGYCYSFNSEVSEVSTGCVGV